MANISQITDWLNAGVAALTLLKAARDNLPAGDERLAIDAKIQDAEESLALAKANMAKALGYKLCRCTFPPQTMLWNERENADICPECGHPIPGPGRVVRERPGGGSWTSR